MNETTEANYVTTLGYERAPDGGKLCVHCGRHFPRADGSVMRGHRRRCSVYQADPYTPAVCDS